ncbi:MAG: hypothetical protein AABX27_02240 [Nanoarchaeota archaeon]
MDLGIKLENGIIKTIAYEKPLARRIGVSAMPIVIEKSLEEGLDDLAKTAQEEEQEACWLYVHDDSKWFNLVSEHFEADTQNGHMVGIVQGYMPVNLGNKRKTHYHTHPKKSVDEAIRQDLKISLAIAGKWEKNCHLLNYIFPSVNDIESYMLVAPKQPVNMDFGIVSAEFIAQIDSVPFSPNIEVRRIYTQMYERFHYNSIGNSVMENPQMLLHELAETHCKKLNRIRGLSIIIRGH